MRWRVASRRGRARPRARSERQCNRGHPAGPGCEDDAPGAVRVTAHDAAVRGSSSVHAACADRGPDTRPARAAEPGSATQTSTAIRIVSGSRPPVEDVERTRSHPSGGGRHRRGPPADADARARRAPSAARDGPPDEIRPAEQPRGDDRADARGPGGARPTAAAASLSSQTRSRPPRPAQRHAGHHAERQRRDEVVGQDQLAVGGVVDAAARRASSRPPPVPATSSRTIATRPRARRTRRSGSGSRIPSSRRGLERDVDPLPLRPRPDPAPRPRAGRDRRAPPDDQRDQRRRRRPRTRASSPARRARSGHRSASAARGSGPRPAPGRRRRGSRPGPTAHESGPDQRHDDGAGDRPRATQSRPAAPRPPASPRTADAAVTA